MEEIEKKQELGTRKDDYKRGAVRYIDSREVAEIVEKQHKNLLADITRYSKELTKLDFQLSDYFIESTYIVEGQSRTYPCYLVTKKGCEFIAHKLTGIKGTKFTAAYINRFHEMEDTLESRAEQGVSVELENLILQLMKQQTETNKKIMEFVQMFSREKGKQLAGGESCNPFNPGKSVLKERMDMLNTLVDQTAELCGLERNKLLHYMYQTMQEDMDINLKSYLNVYQKETNDDSTSIFHMICSIDKLYEKAVEMNRDVIERKKVYG